jgi:hypothetical protein
VAIFPHLLTVVFTTTSTGTIFFFFFHFYIGAIEQGMSIRDRSIVKGYSPCSFLFGNKHKYRKKETTEREQSK